jgi:hypothetical protein
MTAIHFTGPLQSGSIFAANGSPAILGQNVANVGYVRMSQSVAITQAGTQPASVAVAIVIPAYSQIEGIDLISSVLWATSGQVSVGTSSAATELASLTAASALYKVTFVPSTAPQGTLWTNVGATDVQIWVKTDVGTGGTGTLNVRYIQALNAP